MLTELEQVYVPEDVLRLYAIALLRATNPDIKDRELKERYEDSFLSQIHPGIALSRNPVSKFLSAYGYLSNDLLKGLSHENT